MTFRTVTSLALAAGCVLALSLPAQAQSMNTQVLTNGPRLNAGDRADWLAARNNAESAQYDRLVATNPGFRQARMQKECGPIADPQLRQNCMASFGQAEPAMGPGGEVFTGSSTSPGMRGYNQSTNYGAGR
jgi:hypothetical protein